MRVLSCRHLHVAVLIHDARIDVVTEKDLSDRYRTASIGDSDLRANGEVLHVCLDELFRPRRPVHIDRLRALVVPGGGHQRAETRRMIIMMVREENDSDVSNVEASLGNTARGPVAGIDYIECPFTISK